ncbi:MAG: histidine kinase [Candidatus Marinimicrobia bacterium]|nr:histidine kinase [Candidatus Neomarinimicrobiota bacterium]
MGLIKRIREHSFELQHFIILFIILAVFQFALSYLNKFSSNSLISKTMSLYKKDSAEKIANLSTTSLELLLENNLNKHTTESSQEDIIEAFNIIFSQQMLQENVNEICILITKDDKIYAIDDGLSLYSYFFQHQLPESENNRHEYAANKFLEFRETFKRSEKIVSVMGEDHSFYNYVPLVLRGEYQGAVYLKITPNIESITEEIVDTYNQMSILFTSLVLFGLLAMFYITSFTVEERDETRELLFRESEAKLKREVEYAKESLFTKRIYHVHHKAEKIMGFIKEEIRNLTVDNIETFKYITSKYANFVSRVIYDMKWYDAPIHATRNPMFCANINEILTFQVNHIFNRVYGQDSGYQFILELDPQLKNVAINEYVIWEVFEPLIQNAIEHNGQDEMVITIKTHYDSRNRKGYIYIKDNGKGIPPGMLARDANGIQKIFKENFSSKTESVNSGYGCYIAFEIATRKCGWTMKAENPAYGGAAIIIIIPKM